MSQKVLVTGAAGFIGAALVKKLLAQGHQVLGLDNFFPYYDVNLKYARLADSAPATDHAERFKASTTERSKIPSEGPSGSSGQAGSSGPRDYSTGAFQFKELDIADTDAFLAAYAEFKPDRVLHLAAQAGVRYSIDHPHIYAESNLKGFLNVLEACRQHGTKHLVYASSSSVYGANTLMPYSVHHTADHPISLYAATKKANEMMAHAYSHLYKMPATGLRFFTVYGPWGRPDMAVFSFTEKILKGQTIQVFNNGHHRRDFTYVDDIVEGVLRVLWRAPHPNLVWSGNSPDPATSRAPYRLYNIGNHQPVLLSDFISTLEKVIGKKAILEMKPMQPGDVPDTFADVSDLERDFEFAPETSIEAGLTQFFAWYKAFYKI